MSAVIEFDVKVIQLQSALTKLKQMFPSATVGIEILYPPSNHVYFQIRVAGKVRGFGEDLDQAMVQIHRFRRSLDPPMLRRVK